MFPVSKYYLSCFKALSFRFADQRQQVSRRRSVIQLTLVGKAEGWHLLALFTIEPGKESVDDTDVGMEPSVRTRGLASEAEQELAVAVSF
jgi:hypothetical protein